MVGFVRPEIPELRVRELERFRACYCGLCHELGREYGLAGRSILNYDFVFLAMLLWDGREDCDYEFRRCAAGLCRKRCVCQSSYPLTTAAGYSVILAYWKADDAVQDSSGAKKLAARAVRRFLRRAYRKAAGSYPDFDREVRARLTRLGAMEREGVRSLDRPADEFASLLSSASSLSSESSRRPLEQLLYHVGRIIYIADGYFDLEEDLKAGRYNPVAARYGLTGAQVDDEVKESLLETLMSSARLAAAAFELMPVSYWTPVTENIIYLGIPSMCRQVLAGTYRMIKKRVPRGNAVITGRTES